MKLKNFSFNLFDLCLVLCLVLFVGAGYRMVTATYRIAPPQASSDTIQWARITLSIDSERQWLCEHTAGQPEELDSRSGEIIARVLGCVGAPGSQEIEILVRALTDAQGRPIFKNALLVPGRTVRMETDRAVFEGVVHQVALLIDPPAGL